ncbi:MAG: hypothetical protein NC224_00545 [Bacteroides sp.]|nr:hypothetical protein [Bacteroides sp.]
MSKQILVMEEDLSFIIWSLCLRFFKGGMRDSFEYNTHTFPYRDESVGVLNTKEYQI